MAAETASTDPLNAKRRGWNSPLANGLWRFVVTQPFGTVGVLIMLALAFLAVTAPWLAPFDPTESNPSALRVAPNLVHWLGTDAFGRDNFSRLVHGARISLAVGVGASGLGILIGGTIGIAATYWGGWIDVIVQRIMDALLAFPMLLLALAMGAALGSSLQNVIIALSMPIIPKAARIARSSVLVVKETTFIEASRAIGCSDPRIIVVHIVPNVFAPLLVIATSYMGLAVLQEASLSYLGAGIREPMASWGLMMSGAATTLALTAPWIIIFPGLAIFLTVLAANLVGDAIRDFLDPKLRSR